MLMQVRPKPIPATIGTVFGGVWALIAVFALPPAWHLPVAPLVLLATGAMLALLWRTSAAASSDPSMFRRWPYQLAVAAEVIAIYLGGVTLPRVGLHPYFIQAVGLIVGLHFLGLWAATRSMRFVYIAITMCLIAVIALGLPTVAGSTRLRDLFTGAGNALVLWLGIRPWRTAGLR